MFGAPFPDVIPDEFHPTPLTSYGTQKLIGEALLADYTRRGFFDGIGIRLPTICVRPGKPNKAASSFFSGIIREPLNGEEAILPVPRSVVHTLASPRSAVNFLLHAATIDGDAVGPRRNLTMPGVGVSVGEQIEALKRIAGNDIEKLIREEPDDEVWSIVKNWPTRFEARRARELGFAVEQTFDDIIGVISRMSSAGRSGVQARAEQYQSEDEHHARSSDLDGGVEPGSRAAIAGKSNRPVLCSHGHCGQRRNRDGSPERHGEHRQDSAGPQAVQEGETEDDQRARARTDADRGDCRPCRAPVEAVAGKYGRVRRARMTAGFADLARSMGMADHGCGANVPASECFPLRM